MVKRLLDGDEAAFNGLVEQYHGRLLRLALVFVSDRASAEEVVQDTWLAVLTGLRSFEGRSALKTWIFSILTNRAKTRGQRDKRSVPFSAVGGEPGDNGPARVSVPIHGIGKLVGATRAVGRRQPGAAALATRNPRVNRPGDRRAPAGSAGRCHPQGRGGSGLGGSL
jgi:DNA-directed RNA polymerase specialized sigma24 family protein